MNRVSVSAASFFIFACHLIVVQYVLRLLIVRFHEQPWAQGLGALLM